jgi:hypothetical protein
VISAETIAEAERIKQYLADNPYVEEHTIRNRIYQDFMTNCSRYMMTLVLNDVMLA